MRDDCPTHIMKTNLLLDVTLDWLCYIYLPCDQHSDNVY